MAAKVNNRKNPRAKGARGERLLSSEFKKAGFNARPSQEYSLGVGDVIVPELQWLHIASKFTQKKNFLKWLEQAKTEAALTKKAALVCHKRTAHEWIAILPLKELLRILQLHYKGLKIAA